VAQLLGLLLLLVLTWVAFALIAVTAVQSL
jgi:hypothetical protein